MGSWNSQSGVEPGKGNSQRGEDRPWLPRVFPDLFPFPFFIFAKAVPELAPWPRTVCRERLRVRCLTPSGSTSGPHGKLTNEARPEERNLEGGFQETRGQHRLGHGALPEALALPADLPPSRCRARRVLPGLLHGVAWEVAREPREGEKAAGGGRGSASQGSGDSDSTGFGWPYKSGGLLDLETPDKFQAKLREATCAKLAMVLRSNDRIEEGTVVCSPPSQSRFAQSGDTGSSAAVFLKLKKEVAGLSRQEADAIRHTVSCALGLKPRGSRSRTTGADPTRRAPILPRPRLSTIEKSAGAH